MSTDDLRVERNRQLMAAHGLDGCICRLPENVLFFSGWWPLTGTSWVIYTADGDSRLIVPAAEAGEAQADGIEQFAGYEWAHLGAGDPAAQIQAHLTSLAGALGLAGSRIGIEESFEAIAPPLNAGEPAVPTAASKALIQSALPNATLVDATEAIGVMRVCKTPAEVEKLRITNEIAGFALAAFADRVQVGISEIELAACAQSAAMVRGSGYKGVRSARAFAQVASGSGGEKAWRPCEITTGRTLQEGDIAMLELAVVADGYWADVTRTAVAGRAGDEQRRLYEMLLAAQAAGVDAIRPGATMSSVDKAARDVVDASGYGEHFLHVTGHGIGWRYHEVPPLLHPQNDAVLEVGMVTSVEPGVYVPGFGGLRIEDNVAVGETGPDVLTTFERQWPA